MQNMQRIWLAGAALFAAAAGAQVEVDLKVDPSVAAQYEPVRAELTVRNKTGQTLILLASNANASVGYEIKDLDGVIVNRRAGVDLPGPMIVPPQSQASMTNYLQRYYDIRKAGPFTVLARVEWAGKAFAAEKVFVDVVPGMVVDTILAQVADGTTRTYTLRKLNRDKSLHLLARADDEGKGLCYGTYDLGECVSMGKPTAQVDAAGRLHVLHQASPFRHVYTVMAPDGEILNRKVYNGPYGAVSMNTAADGGIAIKEAPPEKIRNDPRKLDSLPSRKRSIDR
jgi:hypothetical protein